MSYLGRFQLGSTAPLYLRCINASKAPALPDLPPVARVFSGTTLVQSSQMPIEDRYTVTGQFRLPLFLGRLYSTGKYQVVYYYRVGGFYGMAEDSFEVVGGGDARGAVASAYYYERPEASYVVQSTENGSIIKGRNPSI